MNIKYLSSILVVISCITMGFMAPSYAEDSLPSASEPAMSGSDLTLEDAVAAALKHNPDLNVSRFNTQLAETEKLQASLLPNPELEFEYENFDEPEKTLSIGYLIELGGKRKNRMELADASSVQASAEYDSAKIEVIYETASAFVDVMIAQENLQIAREKEKLADQVYQTARERVLAGRVSPMEEVTAEIKKSNAIIEVQKAEDELHIARTALSSMWGSPAPDFKTAAGQFDRVQPVPSFDVLTAALDSSPAIKTRLSEIKTAETTLGLEKSNRIPDLSLFGGMKKTDETDDTIYIVGVSVPIPLFDRNQAGVQQAAITLDQQSAALFAERNKISKDLKIAYRMLQTAYNEVNTIKTNILPSARKVLNAVKEGYQEGEFSFLDMLEAQSTLYESHENYVQSLGQYHHAVIDLEKLLGRDISEFNGNDLSVSE